MQGRERKRLDQDHDSDGEKIAENVVREMALPLALVDNKICAVDETWSAVRLVVRLVNRIPVPGKASLV